jgi:hypothetical protein
MIMELGSGIRLDRPLPKGWRWHEQAEPEISTELLIGMVRGDTGIGVHRQLKPLQYAHPPSSRLPAVLREQLHHPELAFDGGPVTGPI